MDFPKISESRELAIVGLSDFLSNFCFPEGQKCLAKWTTFVWQIGSDFLTSWTTFVSLKVRNVQVNNFCSWHPEQLLFSTFIFYATWYTKQLFVFWSFFWEIIELVPIQWWHMSINVSWLIARCQDFLCSMEFPNTGTKIRHRDLSQGCLIWSWLMVYHLSNNI